jgi:hypothetical protein
MQKFLRIVKDDGSAAYLNYDRIEQIDIDTNLTQASIRMVDRQDPIIVRGTHYAALIEHLGTDQESA